MNIFDYINVYQKEWKEVKSREFSSDEIARIQSAVVVIGEHGKSVQFISEKGYQYISLEPSSAAIVSVGEVLDMNKLILVNLEYIGNKPEQKIKKCLKIRINQEVAKEATFDNPFGL